MVEVPAVGNRICSIPDCDRRHYARGWCAKHYSKWRRSGTPEPTVWAKDGQCSIDGCGGAPDARGLCSTHYNRWRRTGTTDTPRRINGADCSVAGCGRPAKTRTWCPAHYSRWRQYGDVQADRPVLQIKPTVVNGEQQCNGCRRWLPVDNFQPRSPGTCVECRTAKEAAWREANRDYWREWQRTNPDKVQAVVQMRRAAKLTLPRERVDRNVIFERDDYTCQLCMEPLDMQAGRSQPLAATIDHIVPLSKGGHHTYANTQAAHFRCNVAKGNRTA